MKGLLVILPILVFLVFLWITYTNINLFVTIIRCLKKDKTLECALSTVGKIFYVGLLIIYVACFVGCLYFMIISAMNNKYNDASLPLNIIAIVSLVSGYLFQQVIFIGRRDMLIGKIQLDYRKIKRVNYPKPTTLSFSYGQKSYSTSLRFMDESKMKKALQRTR